MIEYNWAFVAGAYGLTWAVILGYTVHLFRTLRASKRALENANAVSFNGVER